jgi:hypothetical protein
MGSALSIVDVSEVGGGGESAEDGDGGEGFAVVGADAAAVQPADGVGHGGEVVGMGWEVCAASARIFAGQVVVMSMMTGRCGGRPWRSRFWYLSQV